MKLILPPGYGPRLAISKGMVDKPLPALLYRVSSGYPHCTYSCASIYGLGL